MTYAPSAVYAESGLVITNNGLGTAFAKTAADYGSLRAFAAGTSSQTIVGPDVLTGAGWSSATALFEDTWTIRVPGLDGQPGRIRLAMDVRGTLSGAVAHPGISNGASWMVAMDRDAATAWISWDFANSTYHENAAVYFDKDITYGQPFTFSLGLTAGATTNYLTAPMAAADYFATAVLQGVNLYDAAGQPVPRFAIQPESGVDYGFVPEPATWAMLAAGLLVVVQRRLLLGWHGQAQRRYA
ncbi:MAG: PEP-CTERM sorting domain-containing protein [Planctomycetes bacterium]|nr:PEP-CTERM sorting domain-containing protein [Planctomycetota bacterium]